MKHIKDFTLNEDENSDKILKQILVDDILKLCKHHERQLDDDEIGQCLQTAMEKYTHYFDFNQKTERDEYYKRKDSKKRKRPAVEWTYNFKGGGWNTEFAVTKEEAIEKAKKRWKDSGSKLDPDEKTFHEASGSPAPYVD